MPLVSAEVPFYEDTVETLYDDESQQIYVVCKRIAENLGLSWGGQFTSLRDHAWLAQEITRLAIQTSQGIKEMVCLPLDYLPYWLSGIQAKRVNPEIFTKLICYQKECAHVLGRYFLKDGVVINPNRPMGSTLDLIETNNGLIVGQLRAVIGTQEKQGAQIVHIYQRLDTIDNNHLRLEDLYLPTKRSRLIREQRSNSYHSLDDMRKMAFEITDGHCFARHCRRRIYLYEKQAPSFDVVLHLDHVVAVIFGGNLRWDNIQVLCKRCNRDKETAELAAGRSVYTWDFRDFYPTFKAKCAEYQHTDDIRRQNEIAPLMLSFHDSCPPFNSGDA